MATWTVFDNWKLDQFNGTPVNFAAAGDTLKISLHTSTYVPSTSADHFFTSATNEVSGTNYTAGGYTLANKTCTVASSVVTFANTVNPSWAQNAGGFTTARIAVLRKDTGVAGTSVLIAWADLGANVGNVAGSLTLQLDAAGQIFTAT